MWFGKKQEPVRAEGNVKFEQVKMYVRDGKSIKQALMIESFTPTKAQMIVLNGIIRDREEANVWY